MPATEPAFRARVNVSADQLIAGFAVSINCRFWVSTEGAKIVVAAGAGMVVIVVVYP
jgi:hypothetical protein